LAAGKSDPKIRVVAENRKARHDYQLDEIVEAGLVLTGTEVKSMREGKANIAESYAAPENDGIWLINANIPEYSKGNRENHEPKRPRKLLLHKREIAKMVQAVERKGYTLVPLKLFFNSRGIVKLDIAIAQGKKSHDKRDTEKTRDWNRQKQRLMRERG